MCSFKVFFMADIEAKMTTQRPCLYVWTFLYSFLKKKMSSTTVSTTAVMEKLYSEEAARNVMDEGPVEYSSAGMSTEYKYIGHDRGHGRNRQPTNQFCPAICKYPVFFSHLRSMLQLK